MENMNQFFRILTGLLFLTNHVSAQNPAETYFLQAASSFSTFGQSTSQGFTVSANSTFTLRFTSDYACDCAVVKVSQIQAFTSNQSYTSSASFSAKFGTKNITLGPGSYYLAVRNRVASANSYSVELDKRSSSYQDTSGRYTYAAALMNTSRAVPIGGKLWQQFTIKTGFRYFLDGCNSGVRSYVIPASEIESFKSGSSFEYFTAYSDNNKSNPGLFELKLAPGSYYFCSANETDTPRTITYTLNAWKVTGTATGIGDSLELSGTFKWSISSGSATLSAEKISNNGSQTSGSLRLRLWATSSPFSGGTISGYVLATSASLNPIEAGYYYSDLNLRGAFRRPPKGWYYTTLTLEQYTSSGWQIFDYGNFDGTTQF